MPDSETHRQWNRREFLKAALAAAGAAVALQPRLSLSAERTDVARWAFLSDTHISVNPENRYRGFYPYRNLQTVVAQMASDLPEGLVVAGDLARLTGHAGDYENLKALLAPITEQRPTYMTIGNHDSRRNFLRAFEYLEDGASVHWRKHVVAADTGPVRLVLLDSLLFSNMSWGLVGGAQRVWLREYLRTFDDKPALLFIHHDVGPGTSLLDVSRLWDIIVPARQVKAVVHGHSHGFGFKRFEGVHVINLPASGYNLHDGDPVGWVQAQLTPEDGRFVLHSIGGNARLDGYTTTLRWRT
jgi:3',5'-cyclic AMP phosphodiesterase CpdA